MNNKTNSLEEYVNFVDNPEELLVFNIHTQTRLRSTNDTF